LNHYLFEVFIGFNRLSIVDRAVLAAKVLLGGQYTGNNTLCDDLVASVCHNDHVEDVKLGDVQVVQYFHVDKVGVDGRGRWSCLLSLFLRMVKGSLCGDGVEYFVVDVNLLLFLF
jgi:hypothetical protein